MSNHDVSSIVVLHALDNVGVARHVINPGQVISVGQSKLSARALIRPGHKIALSDIGLGEAVRKYGQVIGAASASIAAGDHVHSHNLACQGFSRDYAIASERPTPPKIDEPRTFQGYWRDDGRVGTRNMIAVISSVNCSASTCRRIADHFTPDRMKAFPNVDGVFSVTHQTGCGMAASGLDRTRLQRTLQGIARHPNVFAAVVIGLGCEVNQAGELFEADRLAGRSARPPKVMAIQALGGISKTVRAGIQAVEELLELANAVVRTPQPISRLIMGTNCGGSDGYSGITANPALGVVSDLVVAHGGTSILAETTEVYGAEHLLTRRAVSPGVAQKLLDRIRWWEEYTAMFGAEINNNPSYGNKEGGLTTIFEKSLGAVAKGGSTALVDVLEYAQEVRTPGLVMMDTPGFDPVSVTGIVAGGANVVVFTTGRGSVLGTKPAPCIKAATNTPLFEHMEEDMDFDAGAILSGASVEEVGGRLFEKVLAVASGEKTKSEVQGLGEDEIVPWIIGPIL